MSSHLDASVHQLASSLHVSRSARGVRLVSDTKRQHSGDEAGKVIHTVVVSAALFVSNIRNRLWVVACAAAARSEKSNALCQPRADAAEVQSAWVIVTVLTALACAAYHRTSFSAGLHAIRPSTYGTY